MYGMCPAPRKILLYNNKTYSRNRKKNHWIRFSELFSRKKQKIHTQREKEKREKEKKVMLCIFNTLIHRITGILAANKRAKLKRFLL